MLKLFCVCHYDTQYLAKKHPKNTLQIWLKIVSKTAKGWRKKKNTFNLSNWKGLRYFYPQKKCFVNAIDNYSENDREKNTPKRHKKTVIKS